MVGEGVVSGMGGIVLFMLSYSVFIMCVYGDLVFREYIQPPATGPNNRMHGSSSNTSIFATFTIINMHHLSDTRIQENKLLEKSLFT